MPITPCLRLRFCTPVLRRWTPAICSQFLQIYDSSDSFSSSLVVLAICSHHEMKSICYSKTSAVLYQQRVTSACLITNYVAGILAFVRTVSWNPCICYVAGILAFVRTVSRIWIFSFALCLHSRLNGFGSSMRNLRVCVLPFCAHSTTLHCRCPLV